MALSKEDKHDVKTHMGKALANKVSTVTKDRYIKTNYGYGKVKGVGDHPKSHSQMMKEGGYGKK